MKSLTQMRITLATFDRLSRQDSRELLDAFEAALKEIDAAERRGELTRGAANDIRNALQGNK